MERNDCFKNVGRRNERIIKIQIKFSKKWHGIAGVKRSFGWPVYECVSIQRYVLAERRLVSQFSLLPDYETDAEWQLQCSSWIELLIVDDDF